MRIFALLLAIVLLLPGGCAIAFIPEMLNPGQFLYMLVLMFWVPGAALGLIGIVLFYLMWTTRRMVPLGTIRDGSDVVLMLIMGVAALCFAPIAALLMSGMILASVVFVIGLCASAYALYGMRKILRGLPSSENVDDGEDD